MVKLTESLVLARSRASDLESVRKLNVWGSELTDVSIIRKLSTVQVVSLSVNKITTLADFSYCLNLEELYIRKNNIQDLSEICHLCKLPKLRVLWLADNPCASVDHYRMTVLKILPNLQKLDNKVVQDEEKNLAIEQGLDLELRKSGEVNCEASSGAERVSSVEHTVTEKGDEGAVALPTQEVVRECPSSSAVSEEETNTIRQELGLKPLSHEKFVSSKPNPSNKAKARNANLLQAALCLVKELDPESLEVLADAVRNRLDAL